MGVVMSCFCCCGTFAKREHQASAAPGEKSAGMTVSKLELNACIYIYVLLVAGQIPSRPTSAVSVNQINVFCDAND